jgi:glutaconate CoA-transferase subunit A
MDDLSPRRAPERPGALGHHPGRDKVVPLAEAVRRHVKPGATVALGTCLEQMIPFAAAHEIIRQGIGDLTLVGPVSDIAFDQLIGAGMVRRVMAAWVGNVMMGPSHAYRRAVDDGIPRGLEVVEFSNFTLAQALHAAAIGAPFLPTRTALGSDIVGRNSFLRRIVDPVGGDPVLAVLPLHPDVALIHVQRADPHGNGAMWEASKHCDTVRAARAVIPPPKRSSLGDQTGSQSGHGLSLCVAAVCEARWGVHPSPSRSCTAATMRRTPTTSRDAYRRGFAEWRQLNRRVQASRVCGAGRELSGSRRSFHSSTTTRSRSTMVLARRGVLSVSRCDARRRPCHRAEPLLVTPLVRDLPRG